jgi:purine nucleosidase/pyrimidine-specific ribonucleoside hydrolase
MPERVIIDTDPGIDDALALLLALRSPELDIAAITTVSGNVGVETATANVFRILSLLPDVPHPPVARGASRPRRKDPVYATHVHGVDGLGGSGSRRDDGSNSGPARLSGRDAADEILHQLAVVPHPLTLIALGPLTNVAAAFERDRETMARANRIVSMGGAISVPGNITPVAEFNIHVDPEAAGIVFQSGIPLTVVPLDVTRQVRLTAGMLQEAMPAQRTPVQQFVCDCTAQAFATAGGAEGAAGIFLHDPLAVGAVIDPSFVSSQAMHVAVETRGEWTDGMTVADRRPFKTPLQEAPNAEVCVGVDAPRFLSFFLERALGTLLPS